MDTDALPRSSSDDMDMNSFIRVEPDSEESDEMKEDPFLDDFPTGQISHDQLKSFRLDKILGKGSFGTVYQAIHLPTGKSCVVKVILKLSQDIRDMAVNEAQVGMSVVSECVCKTFAYAEDGENVFIIMEHIEGMDLYEFIEKRPNIFQSNPCLFLFVSQKIAQGIKDFHHAGFVHADIKPENVFIGLSPDKTQITCVKLIDFGLSKSTSEIKGHTAGTYDYLAPEIAKDDDRDFRIDIWSFGITMYAMFMMAIPSRIASKNPNIYLRKMEVLQNLRKLPTDEVFMPFKAMSTNPKYAMIQQVIMWCLTVNPLSRPTSEEVLAKLREMSSNFQKKDS
jgi:serine/threonine protein kinase